MKNFIVLLSSLMLLSFAGRKDQCTLTLREGVSKGLLKINVSSLGGYSGQCLEAEIRNMSGKHCNVLIEAGSVFNPEDPEMQDILVVKDETIPLDKNNIKKIKLTGFCCKAHNKAPSQGTVFKMGVLKNAKLAELAHFLSKNKFSANVMQSAVWSVSDGESISHIYDENAADVKTLREEVCKLTGQKNVWQNTSVVRHTNDNGYIETAPVKISGEITVKIEKPAALFQGVYKENGEPAWEPHKVADISQTGTMTYQFKLQVKGWDKGKYYVKVTSAGNELLKQEFVI